MKLLFVTAIVAGAVASVHATLRGDIVHRLLQGKDEACAPSDVEETCTGDGPKPHCIPFRSPDYCGEDNSFPSLISNRAKFVKENKEAINDEGWWFQHLDDKVAAYVYSAAQGFNPPKIYCCTLDVPDGLNYYDHPTDAKGFVIRATHLHSTKGVYALPDGFGGKELIRGYNMTLEDVKTDLMTTGATKLIVEEYIAGTGSTDTVDALPIEYKFHVFNGTVGSINIYYGRGTDCACWAEIDTEGNRLDQYGCFTPSGSDQERKSTSTANSSCSAIDFSVGSQQAHPVKGVDLCDKIPDEIEPCVMHDMIRVAEEVGIDVGAYVRVDLFAGADKSVYLQEFSTNHLNGQRHCSARIDPESGNCIDSCFLGRMWNDPGPWNDTNTTMGGPRCPFPDVLTAFLNLTDIDQCRVAEQMPKANKWVATSCVDPSANDTVPTNPTPATNDTTPSPTPARVNAPDDSPSTGSNEEGTTGAVQGAPAYSSVGRALDVTLNLLTPDVLEGYNNTDDLSNDLNQAVRFYLNSIIDKEAIVRDFTMVHDGPELLFAGPGPFSQVAASPSAAGATDFETNNQEEGVDEADTVKSDGVYTYAAYGDVIVVWDALTGDLVTNYTLPRAGSEPPPFLDYYVQKPDIRGMLLESSRLVVIVDGYGSEVREARNVTSVFSDALGTRVLVFDTTTLASSNVLTLVTQEDIQGSYRDARAIGANIHLVTTCHIEYYALTDKLYRYNNPVYEGLNATEYKEAARNIVEPLIDNFVATLINDILAYGSPSIPKVSLWQQDLGNNTNIVEQIYSEGAINAFVQLTSFSVADVAGPLTISTAGAFTPSSWGYTYAVDGSLVFAAQGYNWNPELGGSSETTYLLGFKLDGASALPQYLGSVPGYLINQYSLSVYEGHLRVASTVTAWWPIWDPIVDTLPFQTFTTNNTVYIFEIPTGDSVDLQEVARISDLGKEGERFTSIRFFGNVGYAVTFLQTDPFYVLSLDPADAKQLGELEISGFSSYIDSINANNTLLVAVGQEADETGQILGVQITLFDATNATNPVLLHRFTIEEDPDIWSSSDVAWDFKAFRWLPLGVEVGILIMPLRVVAYNTEDLDANFDGFFAYDVSRAGISERLNISHVRSEDFYGCYYGANLPERSLVFNGNVTTMKGHSVISTDLDSGEQRWTLEMPKPQIENACREWVVF